MSSDLLCTIVIIKHKVWMLRETRAQRFVDQLLRCASNRSERTCQSHPIIYPVTHEQFVAQVYGKLWSSKCTGGWWLGSSLFQFDTGISQPYGYILFPGDYKYRLPLKHCHRYCRIWPCNHKCLHYVFVHGPHNSLGHDYPVIDLYIMNGHYNPAAAWPRAKQTLPMTPRPCQIKFISAISVYSAIGWDTS